MRSLPKESFLRKFHLLSVAAVFPVLVAGALAGIFALFRGGTRDVGLRRHCMH